MTNLMEEKTDGTYAWITERNEKRTERDLKWISERLQSFYNIEKIIETKPISIHSPCPYRCFLIYIKHYDVTTEHLVFRHGNCIDMLSKTCQVKEFRPDSSFDDIIIGKKKAKFHNVYINGKDLNPDTILEYSDYVSLREHCFDKHGKLQQLVQWLRNDDERFSLNWKDFGKYVMTHNICNF